MTYVAAEVMPASVFAHPCKLLYTKPMLTRNCSVTWQTELQDRAPIQAQSAIQFWLDRGFSYKRLSQLALDLMAFPDSQAYVERLFSLCGDLTATKRNRTGMSLYTRVFLKLDRHMLH